MITTSSLGPEIGRAVRAAALGVAVAGMLSAQQVKISAGPGSPYVGRPVYEAIRQIQDLTTIPINYEDLKYNYAGDVRNIAYLMTPAQAATTPSPKVIVPKGGSFSVNVPVDPATGKLADVLSVSNALSTAIAAAQAAGIVPGTFTVDSSQPGALFVQPALQHDDNGNVVAAQVALATPVSISFQQAPAMQVLEAIFQQVTKATGARFEAGSGTLVLARPWSKVTITASNEPAKYVLAKLLAGIYQGRASALPAVSYIALFEPQQRYYVFNIQLDIAGAVLPAVPPVAPQQPAGTGQSPGFRKKMSKQRDHVLAYSQAPGNGPSSRQDLPAVIAALVRTKCRAASPSTLPRVPRKRREDGNRRKPGPSFLRFPSSIGNRARTARFQPSHGADSG